MTGRGALAALVMGAALAGVALGPLLAGAFGEEDRAAGGPFVYTPPAGYVASGEPSAQVLSGTVPGTQRVWVRPLAEDGSALASPPNLTLVHVTTPAPLDDEALAGLAAGMPPLFARSGTTWTALRRFVHTRPDGARVAVLEGAARRGTVAFRSLQLAFPDDEGTSIVTASLPEEGAARTVPEVEATIDEARGVAHRAAPVPLGAKLGWGAAVAVAAFAIGAFTMRFGKRRGAA